jgi:hypothetical protein
LLRKLATLVVPVAILLVAAGCGSSGSDVSVRGDKSSTAAAGAADGSALQTVSYQGVSFQVPADWPVYDLAADPARCVRFDDHAVYLGTSGDAQDCPAGIIGRSEAIQVQPIDPDAQPAVSGSPTSQDINGLNAEVTTDLTGREIDVTLPSSGLSATITWSDDGNGGSVALQILQSFRGSTG